MELYLDVCGRRRTAARASEFATESLGVSLPYLSRIVPEITGRTLRDFLLRKQLQKAEGLLSSTSLTVNEIALRCGFGTTWTFYRRFREAYGTTPAAFREVKK